ncbi:hypothetical protein PsorP6_015495 [Peronosclerospora sorghi]|uniref:Uncharacterized protein n=1 Tax=Peronosclerospora sorghi TaxID=230839 RepID=A0ACC0WNU3_9STRA|nr:hypothetical protein PsorP6_015495 [Peronosclerospora sorghi]
MSSNAFAELQAALIDQFLVETHPKVRGRPLQLLIRCQLSEAVEDTHTLRLQLQIPWTRVISVSANAHVRAPGLELFPLMVSNQPFDQETEIALYQHYAMKLKCGPMKVTMIILPTCWTIVAAEKFMTLLYYRLLVEDRAISTTELQHGDRSCLVDVSCDVDQSDIRLLVLDLESIRRWVHPGLLLT